MLSSLVSILSVVTYAFASEASEWQYRSRPDLIVPRFNITDTSNATSSKYIFVAPYGDSDSDYPYGLGDRQNGPYIFREDGDLIWSGYAYLVGWPFNFQAAKYNGSDILFIFEGNEAFKGHGHGHFKFFDQSYQVTKQINAGNHLFADAHEFNIVDGNKALIDLYEPIPVDLTPYGISSDRNWIWDCKFQELNIDTGEVLFEWSSFDHVKPSASLMPIIIAGNATNNKNAWDYFHMNSIDKYDNGDYLVSARHTSTIYKVNGTTGDIIWQLGGTEFFTESDFDTDDVYFNYQHHARIQSTNGTKEVISLFDNNWAGILETDGRSSAQIIELDTSEMTAKLLYNATAPYGILASSQGSVQVLDNDNVFVNWGSAGAISEFDSEGNLLFHAYLDKDVQKTQNYRGFKFDWTGKPSEAIAIYSEYDDDDNTYVYVSWNGDTETDEWKFYEVTSDGDNKLIGTESRDSFETTLQLSSANYTQIFAAAYDSDGKILGASKKSKPIKQVISLD